MWNLIKYFISVYVVWEIIERLASLAALIFRVITSYPQYATYGYLWLDSNFYNLNILHYNFTENI